MKTYQQIKKAKRLSDGKQFDFTKTAYEVPYERNELYFKLLSEQDPRQPSNLFEPIQDYYLYADFSHEYNYYSPRYETYTSEVSNNTDYGFYLHVPLDLFLLSQSSEITLPMDYRKLSDEFFLRPDQTPQLRLSEDYFETRRHWLAYYESELQNNPGSILSRTEKAMPGFFLPEFINKQVMEIYYDRQSMRESFPFYTKFKMTGIHKNDFCNILVQHGLEDIFVDFLAAERASGETGIVLFEQYFMDEVSTFGSELYVYELEAFIDFLDAGNYGHILNYSNWQSQTTCEYFESFIHGLMFKSLLRQFISTAPLDEFFTVAFLMNKMDDDGRHVSSHYFFNYSDMEDFIYYDSRVPYEENIKYEVRVISGIVQEDLNGIRFVYFVEQPFYEETIFIADSPPIAPDVELLTYRGVDNKVLILFNQMIDKKVQVPIFINPSDEENFLEKQYPSQQIQPYNPIIYESDDPTDFELFRVDRKPTKYKDFIHGKYLTIKTHNATSAAFEDKIMPNRYYYYTFRSQDMHGYVSNPTPVYEFVLIKEGETLYPRIRIIKFAKPEPPVQKTRSFKKYVKIGFSPRQYQIPEDQVQNINTGLINNDIPIGISEDNIIGSDRTFKFRIRSKSTGKLIDINVTFKKNKVIKE